MNLDAEPTREAEWISQVIANDDHLAFAQLVRLHQSAVRNFLRRLSGGDTGRADDLAQETFWRAYRHLHSYNATGRFLSWLFGIAYQMFITEQRRQSITFVELSDDLPATDHHQAFVEQRSFEQLMLLLRPEERATIVLHYRHDMAHPEIAQALNLPLGSVKTLIRRGRQKLEAYCGPSIQE